MRAFLSRSCRDDHGIGIACRLGAPGNSREIRQYGSFLEQESAFCARFSPRNEPFARQPAAGGSENRTAINHRFFEMEESHGRIQPWDPARGHSTATRRSKLLPE